MSLSDRLKTIWDSYSVRRRAHGAGYPADVVEERTRFRVLLVLREVFSGKWSEALSPEDRSEQFWSEIHEFLQHLHGQPMLVVQGSPLEDCLEFLRACSGDLFLDFVEGVFKVRAVRVLGLDYNPLVNAINDVLRFESTPYQLTSHVLIEEPVPTGPFAGRPSFRTGAFPKVIRVDEEIVHVEAMLPALAVLADVAYAGADAELRGALADYRSGDYGDAVAKAGSSLESVLKVLCEKNGIVFDKHKDTAGPLLDRVLAQSKLDTATFKDALFGVPKLRNRLSSAHGGGSTVKTVDRHVAQFALTSAAAAIVLLVHDMG